MSQINRPPIGLQSLFGSKNFGQNPSELSQIVSPSVDLFTFLAQQELRFLKESVTTAGFDSVVEIQVPDNQIWAVLTVSFAAEVLSASNDDMYAQIALSENFAGAVRYIVHSSEVPPQNTPYRNGTFWATVWQPSQLWWMRSGTVIRGIWNGSNIASKDFDLDVVYYRLEV